MCALAISCTNVVEVPAHPHRRMFALRTDNVTRGRTQLCADLVCVRRSPLFPPQKTHRLDERRGLNMEPHKKPRGDRANVHGPP